MTATTKFNKVAVSKLLAICEKNGMKVTAQPSQFKVEGPAGQKFYFANPKVKEGNEARTNFIQLSGHSSPLAISWEQAYPGKKAPSPKITQVIDMTQDEKLILRAFFKITKAMAPKAEKPVVTETPASSPETTETPAIEQAVA